MEKLKYLAVEGPIGVGKTSLTRMLAEDLGARLILEEPANNPFLSTFYEDPDRFAFQTQLFFLLSRYRQQVELKQQDLFNQITVCDYVFAKDQIFAHMNLTPEEISLYEEVYQLLDARLPKPDLVIFLQASPDVLMNRVRKRNEVYEKSLRYEYVEQLSQAYSNFFFKYQETPLLVVNASGIDFVNNKKDYDTLKKELYHMIKTRKDRHYITIDSR
ncbi:MAG: deoxyadenosine kinase [Deltaproteobacteria bacterium RIFCSPLOWO2_12_FULL_40_28]|nr:MAG: deoxyadenosine kinase [Deltaproteobacteria bacterium RIFCSPHIGHO2_02_FULL_40_28]OGQ19487.1 MAG: deoxyadenosine kinase [Deltaproteobacteria bacterium RIFCSPHIGHO2_12_FULL_40_32]OGQ39961.1 MAG: deoxyadenosine kinase [Deltaproteobacteria bacterium RIFCSPLOWO2_02_FULL_40_36]OGQ54365.1 MAG: deoxyadenosine kinase [Deltaproteobacteria bacterium RIFCSPLOWO2_12_FULL_40_28]